MHIVGNHTTTGKNPEKSPERLSTAHSRELGDELRRIRHAAGLSAGQIKEVLGWSMGKLSKLETGSRGTSLWEIGTLLGRCGADKATRDRILALAAEPDTGSFLRLHHDTPDLLTALTIHERTACAITAYGALTIPALAQTEDYAAALTDDPDLARARVTRQEILHRRTAPSTVLYIHEAALNLVVGDAVVMRDQLLHLTLMCNWDNVTPQVIPLTAPAHPALAHAATLLTLPSPLRPVAYTETDAATLFHDDPVAVAGYQAKMQLLKRSALSPAGSQEVFARRANTYDRQAC